MPNYYGMEFPDGTNSIAVEIYCYMYDERLEKDHEVDHERRRDDFEIVRGEGERVNRWYHFCNLVDLLWNWREGEHGANLQRVIWNVWTDKMLRAMVENDVVSLAGCASCVSGDTRILNPITGEQPTIRELCESKTTPTVATLNGAVKADVPYLKGRDELLRYEMSDGSVIDVTPAHRFLTPSGYVKASLLGVGDSLFGYAPSPPQTSLDIAPLDPPLDALHYLQTTVDSQSDCRPLSRLCGEQLHQAIECAQSLSPSLSDAQEYSECAFEHSGDLLSESEHNHLCQSIGLSIDSASHPYSTPNCYSFSQSHSAQGTSSLQDPLFQQCDQSPREKHRLLTSESLDHGSDHIECRDYASCQPEELKPHYCEVCDLSFSHSDQTCQHLAECCCSVESETLSEHSAQPTVVSSDYLSCDYRVAVVQVVSITSLGEHDFYDMNVPGEHHYFAEGVINHNSGKSAAAAIYAIVQFLCAPNESLVLITSTSIKGAQLRVWKCLSQYWHSLPKSVKFGEMVYSKCMIRGWDKNSEKTDSIGIQIVAAGSGSEKDAYDTLVGIKQERLYLIADELPQLPKMIIEAAFGNMVNGTNKEKQEFKMIAMGNPALMTDAFGDMCEPIEGWNSVSEMDDSWETERGIVLRFDAERNPNILAGEDLYSWYPSKDAIKKAKSRWGEKSLMFYKQYKAFWYREASTETIYSENEIVLTRSNKPYDPEKDGEVASRKPVSGADPAFTQGGDEFPQVVADVVTNIQGKTFLEVKHARALEDDSSDERPRSHKMVDQLRAYCSKHAVDPACFGYDATGTGIAFRDIVVSEWSSLCKDINFGGNPSDRNAGASDTRKSSDVYRNRVSELWVKAKGLIREGRIRGLTDKMISQMCARRYNTTRYGAGSKVCIESKTDMKKREGYSPDFADCLFIVLEVAILNGLMFDVEVANLSKRSSPSWDKAVHQHDVLSGANLYH